MPELAVVVIAYLLGSIPTALIVSRVVAGADIRDLGDGNMGARNVSHVLGWRPAIAVAVADTAKGAAGVLASQAIGVDPVWQLAAGAGVVIGHDFPVFAKFRGGQGFAAAVGVFLVIVPFETLIGLSAFALVYLVTRGYNVSAGAGMGSLFASAVTSGQPPVLLAYVAAMLLSVPAKKVLDLPRRRSLERLRHQAAHRLP